MIDIDIVIQNIENKIRVLENRNFDEQPKSFLYGPITAVTITNTTDFQKLECQKVKRCPSDSQLTSIKSSGSCESSNSATSPKFSRSYAEFLKNLNSDMRKFKEQQKRNESCDNFLGKHAKIFKDEAEKTEEDESSNQESNSKDLEVDAGTKKVEVKDLTEEMQKNMQNLQNSPSLKRRMTMEANPLLLGRLNQPPALQYRHPSTSEKSKYTSRFAIPRRNSIGFLPKAEHLKSIKGSVENQKPALKAIKIDRIIGNSRPGSDCSKSVKKSDIKCSKIIKSGNLGTLDVNRSKKCEGSQIGSIRKSTESIKKWTGKIGIYPEMSGSDLKPSNVPAANAQTTSELPQTDQHPQDTENEAQNNSATGKRKRQVNPKYKESEYLLKNTSREFTNAIRSKLPISKSQKCPSRKQSLKSDDLQPLKMEVEQSVMEISDLKEIDQSILTVPIETILDDDV